MTQIADPIFEQFFIGDINTQLLVAKDSTTGGMSVNNCVVVNNGSSDITTLPDNAVVNAALVRTAINNLQSSITTLTGMDTSTTTALMQLQQSFQADGNLTSVLGKIQTLQNNSSTMNNTITSMTNTLSGWQSSVSTISAGPYVTLTPIYNSNSYVANVGNWQMQIFNVRPRPS